MDVCSFFKDDLKGHKDMNGDIVKKKKKIYKYKYLYVASKELTGFF